MYDENIVKSKIAGQCMMNKSKIANQCMMNKK